MYPLPNYKVILPPPLYKSSSCASDCVSIVIFNCLIASNARYARCLFIFCVIVYKLYYCCYAKTSSSAVQKRHSKVYGKPIAPSLYSILFELDYHLYTITPEMVHSIVYKQSCGVNLYIQF